MYVNNACFLCMWTIFMHSEGSGGKAVWGMAKVAWSDQPGEEKIKGSLQLPHEDKQRGRHQSILSSHQWQDPREWMKLFQERFRLVITEMVLIQRVVERWNGLPREVVTAPSLTEHTNCLDSALRHHNLMVWFLGLSFAGLRPGLGWSMWVTYNLEYSVKQGILTWAWLLLGQFCSLSLCILFCTDLVLHNGAMCM